VTSPGCTALASGRPWPATPDRVGDFRRTRRGIRVALNPIEVTVLEHVIREVAEVIGPPPAVTDSDSWARKLGLSEPNGLGDAGQGWPAPADPVRSRLFPAAYPDDDEAASEFRRFTEDDLRAGKAANAGAVLDSLPERGGAIALDDDGCAAWLGALNDARLAVGTALEVDENTQNELAALPISDPRAQRLAVYLWLGELQDSLLEALNGE
jgi:hypothetical protein